MVIRFYSALLFAALVSLPAQADSLSLAVNQDYDSHLSDLFEFFHRNPELSMMEYKTSERLAAELRETGFEVTEKVGGTGIVAIMENGPGPIVMMRADMDGLPVQEKSGLPYASTAKQVDWDGNEVYVMHACGHDVHITSLVGTARYMATHQNDWSGTLMLIGQPAEERGIGARKMMENNLWKLFGKPDYALAFHVASLIPAGKLVADPSAPYSGADTVDIIIHGVGAHGASPHGGIDPIVLGSQIVLGLQTVVSRTLPPREPGVITVGSFHSGTKHNIISDRAHLQLTVRSESPEMRRLLLDGIRRVAVNMGRVAGLPEDKLPEVIVSEESVPPTINDTGLTNDLREEWKVRLGDEIFYEAKRLGMGAEDFGFFTTDPYIPSTYFAVGGTPQAAFDEAEKGGPPIPTNHSPMFKILPKESVTLGVKATVIALLKLLKADTVVQDR